jgi:hypothetical protein
MEETGFFEALLTTYMTRECHRPEDQSQNDKEAYIFMEKNVFQELILSYSIFLVDPTSLYRTAHFTTSLKYSSALQDMQLTTGMPRNPALDVVIITATLLNPLKNSVNLMCQLLLEHSETLHFTHRVYLFPMILRINREHFPK